VNGAMPKVRFCRDAKSMVCASFVIVNACVTGAAPS
jgi:hypothetical protein